MIDSDEEARSPAHQCEFRQAEVVLPHLAFYQSLTLNPLFLRPVPQHIRQDGEAGAKHDIACALPFSLLFFPSLLCLSLSLPLLPSFIFCPRPPFSFFFLLCHPSFLNYLSPPFLSLPSFLSLWALNSCCCARMGLNLTQVWMAKKKQFSAHLPHSFFPLNMTSKFSGGSGVPQITFPHIWKNIEVVTVGQNCKNITNYWKRHAHICRQSTSQKYMHTHPIPTEMAHLTLADSECDHTLRWWERFHTRSVTFLRLWSHHPHPQWRATKTTDRSSHESLDFPLWQRGDD